MGMKRKAKVIRVGKDVQLDKAIYLWFKQKRMKGIPISGPLLCEKALDINKKQLLSMQVKVGSGDFFKGMEFQGEKDQKYSLDQIFNCDETGLNFRLLPDKSLKGSLKSQLMGERKAKTGGNTKSLLR